MAGVSSHLRKSFSAIRAPCKRQAVERHLRDGPRLPLVPPAESRQRPLPPQEGRRRQEIDAATVSPRFAREHSRETVGVGAGVRARAPSAKPQRSTRVRKDPSALRKGPSFRTRARALSSLLPRRPNRPSDALGALSLALALVRFAAEQLDAIGVLQVLRSAPPRRPGRSPASFHAPEAVVLRVSGMNTCTTMLL